VITWSADVSVRNQGLLSLFLFCMFFPICVRLFIVLCLHWIMRSRYGVYVNIFTRHLERLSFGQPTEIELQSKDLVEAFQGNGEFNMYLSEKPC
jgi:hypothetical protein